MKLKELHEGDKFTFVRPINKIRDNWVVEGQYPKKKITTVYSEQYAHDGNDPIAVNDSHEVKLIQKGAYSIYHKVNKGKEENYLLVKIDSHKVVEKQGPASKQSLEAVLNKRHKGLKGYTGMYNITWYTTARKNVGYYILPVNQYNKTFLETHFLTEHLEKSQI